jgi:hemolysin III
MGGRVELAETLSGATDDPPKASGILIFDYSFASMAIYGSLAVMAILVAMEDHPSSALRTAAQLFGVTFAIAVAKAYAEIIADTLHRGRRLNAEEGREILRKVSPVLFGAQGPTLVMLMSAFGFFSVDTAIDVSKVLVLVLLFVYGLRVAQLLHKNRFIQIGSGFVIMSAGGIVVLLNRLFH